MHAIPGPVQGTSPGGVQSAHRPPIWLLGSSGFSARLAGVLGLPFAFAHHFSAQNTVPALDLYRASFRPSAVLAEPYALIGVSVLAADDEREARRQVLATGVNMVRLRSGRPGLFPSPRRRRRTGSARWSASSSTPGRRTSSTAPPTRSAPASTTCTSAPAPTS